MARLISSIAEKHKLSPRPLIAVNKSGGAGAEGFLYVKEKKADPHVIIITLSNLFTTPLHTGVPFNWKDLTPLARMALDEFVLWVNAETPYKTAKEYLAAVKEQSGGGNRMKMGGTGSAQEDPTNIIADQIRAQGYKCDSPQSAKRDAQASKPDEAAWILQCESGSYRVTLIPGDGIGPEVAAAARLVLDAAHSNIE